MNLWSIRFVLLLSMSLLCFGNTIGQLRWREAPLWQDSVHLPGKGTSPKFYNVPVVKPVPPMIPKNYYTQGFGFFCREELKMHRANIPMSFRLGTFENCERLEGKGR